MCTVMRRYRLAVYTCAALLLLLAACRSGEQAPREPEAGPLFSMSRFGARMDSAEREEALYRFVATRLSGPLGVYTNWRETDELAEEASGHEVLSESASLLLRYLALAGKQQEFGAAWVVARDTFDQDKLFSYRYTPKLGKQYTLNAAVDDLRLIRALYEAGEVFGDDGYVREADRYGRRFYQYNVKDGYMYDFYDEAYGITNDFITLCYVDFKTLLRIPAADAREQNRFIEQMSNIVRNGYISDVFPFYETSYNYERGTYSTGSIRTVESMLTVLALAEAGQHEEASVRFIKEKVLGDALYGEYSRDGEPLTDIQSTAIYAIAAMIGSETGDRELYEGAIHRMEAYRVEAADNPLHGGFGDPVTLQAYSFDNLMALLAYRY